MSESRPRGRWEREMLTVQQRQPRGFSPPAAVPNAVNDLLSRLLEDP